MPVTAIAFVLFYAYGLVRAIASDPRWGLYTYLAVFYLHPPIRWWGAPLPEAVRWSLVAALVTVFSLSRAKFPQRATPWSSLTLTKAMIAYVVWMWVQLAWANPSHLDDVILMSKFVLLYFLIYRLVTTEQALVNFAFAHVVGCFYFGWLALDAAGEGRLENLGGPGVGDSNSLGMHVITGLFFAASLILSQKGWHRWFVIMTVPVLTNCVLQTESRGAFLGAVVGAATYYYFAPKRHRKFIVSLGTIAVFILLAYAPATYWERMSTIKVTSNEQEVTDTSSQSRIVLVKAQMRMFADHPFGLGSRTTSYLSRDYLDEMWLTARAGQDRATQGSRASHNTFMSVVTDQGIPGIIIVFIGIGAVLGLIRQLGRFNFGADGHTLALMRAGICASLTAIIVSGMFTNYLRAEVQFWCLGLLAATLQIARLRAADAHEIRNPAETPQGLRA